MRQENVFIAVDGKTFRDRKQCEDHEERLFVAWIKEDPLDLEIVNFLKAERANDGNEIGARAVFRRYWEWRTDNS